MGGWWRYGYTDKFVQRENWAVGRGRKGRKAGPNGDAIDGLVKRWVSCWKLKTDRASLQTRRVGPHPTGSILLEKSGTPKKKTKGIKRNRNCPARYRYRMSKWARRWTTWRWRSESEKGDGIGRVQWVTWMNGKIHERRVKLVSEQILCGACALDPGIVEPLLDVFVWSWPSIDSCMRRKFGQLTSTTIDALFAFPQFGYPTVYGTVMKELKL